jgi:hypothetical protein
MDLYYFPSSVWLIHQLVATLSATTDYCLQKKIKPLCLVRERERERERERTDRTNFATTVLAPKKNITKENRNRSSNFGN